MRLCKQTESDEAEFSKAITKTIVARERNVTNDSYNGPYMVFLLAGNLFVTHKCKASFFRALSFLSERIIMNVITFMTNHIVENQ